MDKITGRFVKDIVNLRSFDAHKGNMGTLLTVCGSYSMPGAAVLCGRGALRSGLGLLNTAVIKSAYPMVMPQLLESIFTPVSESDNGTFSKEAVDTLLLSLKNSDACVIGCGLGNDSNTKAVVSDLITKSEKPLLLDADGINAILENIDILNEAKCPLVLTPHPGEMARLIGKSASFVQQNRESVAKDFTDKYNVTLVLKGAGTLVSKKGKNISVNTTGNSGMATGGSGDVLSGIIGAFLARGIEPYNAACCGVYVHGLCGDIAAKELSKNSMLPTDIIKYLPLTFKTLEDI